MSAAGHPEIPGGKSEGVRKAGGDALRLQLATLCAGHPIDRVIWALVEEITSVCLVGAVNRENADQIADAIGRDIKNGIALNWGTPDTIQARAQMAAVNATPATGRAQ